MTLDWVERLRGADVVAASVGVFVFVHASVGVDVILQYVDIIQYEKQ